MENRFLLLALLPLLVAICGAQHLVGGDDCPPLGVFADPHPKACDHYYKCENGTFSAEICPNGLLFAGRPSVFDFCDYHWAVDCGDRLERPPPISSPDCPWQWGIFPSGSCTHYIKCAWGFANLTDCEPGLAYDEPTHTCNWPDLVPGCDSEAIVGFKCPDKASGPGAKFDPYPRYPHPDCTRLISCVNGKPRLIGCEPGKVFSHHSYTCEPIEHVGAC